MMQSIQLHVPYPDYKLSGLDWPTKVPVDWDIVQLKYIAHLKSGDSISSKDIEENGLFPVYGGNGLRGYTDSYTHEGNFVLIGRQGALCGNIHFADGRFWASEHAIVVTSKPFINVKWLGELLRTLNLNRYSQSAAQPGLAVEHIQNMYIPLPPLQEQDAIANFIDHKTSKIDTLIAELDDLLKLVAEKRQATISQAVTRGINPDVRLVDSGIEWIGEIPEHWEIKRLKHISPQISVGLVINPSSYVEEDGTVPIIVGSNISEGKISVVEARMISEDSNQKLAQSRLYAGDLVTIRVGYPGVTAVIPPELDGINCASVMITRAGKSFNSHWLCYAFNSYIGHANIGLVEYGAAQRQFNISHAVEFLFPVPPQEEQKEIVAYLDYQIVELDGLTRAIEETIQLLHERRSALIAAAVTGKIRVTESPCR